MFIWLVIWSSILIAHAELNPASAERSISNDPDFTAVTPVVAIRPAANMRYVKAPRTAPMAGSNKYQMYQGFLKHLSLTCCQSDQKPCKIPPSAPHKKAQVGTVSTVPLDRAGEKIIADKMTMNDATRYANAGPPKQYLKRHQNPFLLTWLLR